MREGTRFDRFVSHDARRTVATLLDGQGLSARDVADLLGHSRTSMTQDFCRGRRLPPCQAEVRHAVPIHSLAWGEKRDTSRDPDTV